MGAVRGAAKNKVLIAYAMPTRGRPCGPEGPHFLSTALFAPTPHHCDDHGLLTVAKVVVQGAVRVPLGDEGLQVSAAAVVEGAAWVAGV